MNNQYQLYNHKERKFEDPKILIDKEEANKRNKILANYHEPFSWRERQDETRTNNRTN